jgi:hypothetical protein
VGIPTTAVGKIVNPETPYTIEKSAGRCSEIHLTKKTVLLIFEKHIF